jgi:ubiquitin carboxyl-terminal hydrolase 31
MCTLGEDESAASSSSGVPLHVKLVLEWDMPAKSQVINDDTDQIEEHASVKQVEKITD